MLADAPRQGRTPPEGQGTVCAPADSRRAPGAGEGALPAGGGARKRQVEGEADSPLSREPGAGLHPRTPGS
ncbi:unnamed protein product [Nyctereutes procyonoides]|uniref:(raccoon dog) hypothetical protein n=1 Tax=Nyctereutes procyonoides TaxID=34880 RepID=A0A811Y9K0_NYCPR|nr:unnamed protein product [Nyctereutes procyonoides]